MRAAEIDAWVRRLAEEGAKGNTNEDARVELKGEWPKPEDAAWRLGGHANAAHGESILWVIGLMPDGSIAPVKREDLANWWQQVTKHFDDGVAPTLVRDVVVTFDAESVIALFFDTEAAPFVLKGGKHNHEIPYREGTRCDGARRRHLTRMLAPLVRLPDIETLHCSVTYIPRTAVNVAQPSFRLNWSLFAAPRQIQDPPFLVVHRSRLEVATPEKAVFEQAPSFGDETRATGALLVGTARRLTLAAEIMRGEEATELAAASEMTVSLSLAFANTDQALSLRHVLRLVEGPVAGPGVPGTPPTANVSWVWP